MMHFERFQNLFVNLTCSEAVASDYPVLIPAFDWQSQSLSSLMKAINQKINPRPEAPRSADDTPAAMPVAIDTDVTVDAVPSLPIDSPTYLLLQSFQPYNASLLAHIMGQDSAYNMLNSMSAMWDEFLTANGLQPVNIYVAGPTKSSKTEHAKAFAERFKLAYLDLVSGVISILGWSEEQLCFLCSQNSLDLTLVQQFQKELNGGIEAKLNEGKKGKDKGAPIESKVDVSLVTDAVVAGLPAEMRKKAIGLWFSTSTLCKRRGCVWDVWDKGYVNEFNEVYDCIHIFDTKTETSEEVSSESKKQPPIDVVVELQVMSIYFALYLYFILYLLYLYLAHSVTTSGWSANTTITSQHSK
ncbi:hypothetical protein EON65_34525 [archaeon]|nr:MAG: hypothetical protein EON65_34525 [archaeon]